jgi:UDP-3-O-[3-hydroxymyristoyl] glucosamine N-acyltransferase
MMAGSTTIGRRFMTGGNSVVSAHLKLADDVVLAGRSTVTSDVPVSGHYGGYPLQPLKDFMRTLAALGQLTESAGTSIGCSSTCSCRNDRNAFMPSVPRQQTP